MTNHLQQAIRNEMEIRRKNPDEPTPWLTMHNDYCAFIIGDLEYNFWGNALGVEGIDYVTKENGEDIATFMTGSSPLEFLKREELEKLHSMLMLVPVEGKE